ncbi:MAG: adenylate kinase [Eubacteriales bacterium]|nr:adenylate kinase [Eubacteriales bacterium]
MEKVIIIGCPGAGKSTFARKLKEKTGLPLFYLDMIWHKADGTNISRDEFDGKIKEIMKKEQWILDGNYIRTLEMRLKECDTVFLLDYPLELCLEGASSRIGKERPDMPWIESELDLEFRQFIVDFPRDSLPKIYELLKKYEKEKELHIFRKREDAEEYLRTEERNGKV